MAGSEDAAIVEEFADVEEAPAAEEDAPIEAAAEETDDTPEYSEVETKARSEGWRPEAEWEGDPEEWISASQFNRFGSLIESVKASNTKLRDIETTQEQVLANNNLFHQRQADQLRRELDEVKESRTNNIDLANVDGADKDQARIDQLNGEIAGVEAAITETPAAKAETHPIIDAWDDKNAWIKEDTPKAAYAKDKFAAYLNDNQGSATDVNVLVANGILAMEAAIDKAYPAKNPNRDGAPAVARGRNTTRQTTNKLSMSDLSREEKDMYEEFKDVYKTEAEFLEVVKSTRVGV